MHVQTRGAGGGTADAEIKVLSAENPEVSKFFAFKPTLGQNMASHASPAAGILTYGGGGWWVGVSRRDTAEW